jgi:hypothetical protein
VIAAVCTALGLLFILAFAAAWPLLGRLDNRLEADMQPRPSLAEQVQQWLGIDHTHRQLHRIEADMAKVIDLLNGLIAQDTAASAAQATSFHNIDTAFATLQAEVANGDVSPEVQAAVDNLSAGFASLQKAAEDEGKLYAPPADDGGDTPPADNGGTGDVPVVENTKR